MRITRFEHAKQHSVQCTLAHRASFSHLIKVFAFYLQFNRGLHARICAYVYTETSNIVLTPRPTFYSNLFTLLKLAASLLNLNFRLVMFHFFFLSTTLSLSVLHTLRQEDRIQTVQFNRQSERKWLWNWWNTEKKII